MQSQAREGDSPIHEKLILAVPVRIGHKGAVAADKRPRDHSSQKILERLFAVSRPEDGWADERSNNESTGRTLHTHPQR